MQVVYSIMKRGVHEVDKVNAKVVSLLKLQLHRLTISKLVTKTKVDSCSNILMRLLEPRFEKRI
jgi:hypothetical protein